MFRQSRIDGKRFDAYTSNGSLEISSEKLHMSMQSEFSIQSEYFVTPNLFQADNPTLRDRLDSPNRVVAIVDSTVMKIYGELIQKYFSYNQIQFHSIEIQAVEAEKNFDTVVNILNFLGSKELQVQRNESVLVIGGGMISDVAGFACSLQNRRTPYVMVPTTLVAAIDAGPSPRRGVNHAKFKNSFGSFHPPIMTLTDPTFFSSLSRAYVSEGLAEMIKVAIVADKDLFGKMESWGEHLTEDLLQFNSLAEQKKRQVEGLVLQATHAYMKNEVSNIFETHQNRPHAYGHTWSPTFELAAGLRHGEAVSIGMALGATLSLMDGQLLESDYLKILKMLKTYCLPIFHSCLLDKELMQRATDNIIAKRGIGCVHAPAPSGIGECVYLEEVDVNQLLIAAEMLASIEANLNSSSYSSSDLAPTPIQG